MQQGSAICRYFAKSGGCKSGDTCRFFHEPALAVTVTPGGIEFAARRRGDPAVSMQLVRSVGATRAMVDCTRAPSSWPSMTALQSGSARRRSAGASRGGRHRGAAAALRRRALLKLRHEGFAVVSASKGYEVYACPTGFWPRRRPATRRCGKATSSRARWCRPTAARGRPTQGVIQRPTGAKGAALGGPPRSRPRIALWRADLGGPRPWRARS
jgi:hypothetical protein